MVDPAYRIVEGDTAKEVESQVWLAMKNGWKLVGGVSVVRAETHPDNGVKLRFYQAITKGGKHA